MSESRLRVSIPPGQVILSVGGTYQSRDGSEWVCFKVDMAAGQHAQARCIRPEDERIEYFYLDGRYDAAGKREHTLIKRLR